MIRVMARIIARPGALKNDLPAPAESSRNRPGSLGYSQLLRSDALVHAAVAGQGLCVIEAGK